jgi:hypothetical protein
MKFHVILDKPTVTGIQQIVATVDWPDENRIMRAGIMRFDRWADSIGISRAERFAWIKTGMVEVRRIGGVPYITRDATIAFIKRLDAGEFTEISPRTSAYQH